MNPQILVSLASLVVVLPPVVDEEIKAKVTDAFTVMLLTLLVGLIAGALGGALTQISQGASVKDAATVALAGILSGLAAGIRNYYVTRAAAVVR